MIEITDSYVFDNSKTEYWDCNFENPTWQPIVAIFQDGHHNVFDHSKQDYEV